MHSTQPCSYISATRSTALPFVMLPIFTFSLGEDPSCAPQTFTSAYIHIRITRFHDSKISDDMVTPGSIFSKHVSARLNYYVHLVPGLRMSPTHALVTVLPHDTNLLCLQFPKIVHYRYNSWKGLPWISYPYAKLTVHHKQNQAVRSAPLSLPHGNPVIIIRVFTFICKGSPRKYRFHKCKNGVN
jgi:hypothetical protein